MSTDQVLFGVGLILVLAVGLGVLASRRAQGRAPGCQVERR